MSGYANKIYVNSSGGLQWKNGNYNQNATTGKYWSMMGETKQLAIMQAILCTLNTIEYNGNETAAYYAHKFFQLLLMHLDNYGCVESNTNSYNFNANSILIHSQSIEEYLMYYVQIISPLLDGKVRDYIIYIIEDAYYSMGCYKVFPYAYVIFQNIINELYNMKRTMQNTNATLGDFNYQKFATRAYNKIADDYETCLQYAVNPAVCTNFLNRAANTASKVNYIQYNFENGGNY